MAQARRVHPLGAQAPSIAKTIAELWKELPPHERTRYDTLAMEEKLRKYTEKQGWIQYSDDDTNLSNDDDPMKPESVGTQWKTSSSNPEPMSMNETTKELDQDCVDILRRALGP